VDEAEDKDAFFKEKEEGVFKLRDNLKKTGSEGKKYALETVSKYISRKLFHQFSSIALY